MSQTSVPVGPSSARPCDRRGTSSGRNKSHSVERVFGRVWWSTTSPGQCFVFQAASTLRLARSINSSSASIHARRSSKRRCRLDGGGGSDESRSSCVVRNRNRKDGGGCIAAFTESGDAPSFQENDERKVGPSR